MNIEDDEGPDPDYGMFGDIDQPRPLPKIASAREIAEIRRLQKQREMVERTHREFNRHMIDLFNRRMNSG